MASGGLADRTTATPAGAVWTKTCLTLKRELGDATFGSWLGHAALRERSEHEVCLVAATGVARDWIRRHAWRRIGELWAQNDPEGRALDLKSRMEFDGAAPAEPVIAEVTLPATQTPSAPVLTLHEAPAARAVRTHGLQERFTFDTFVPGPANEFAFAVARRVGCWADGHFNPVVFHGPYGFGKTHLLNALRWGGRPCAPPRTRRWSI